MSDPRRTLEALQLRKLRELTAKSLAANPFARSKLAGAGVTAPPESLDDFRARFPFTTKDDLSEDRRKHPPYGSNLTYAPENYTRFCQTSGTSGAPMAWLDTNESWAAMLACWERVYREAGVKPGIDRIFFAFSFGPFLGFWTAYEAAAKLGCLTIPGGGMSSSARLQCLRDHRATVLCCTPTYALRLGEIAAAEKSNSAPSASSVRQIIVAGEPGGSIPATRERIEELWPGARVFDHHGMTEVGPVTYQISDGNPMRPSGLAVIEESYVAEIIDRKSLAEVAEGEEGELVLTTLDRDGCPLFRYRTGDLVRKRRSPTEGRLVLEGGILGRIDDMVVVRGVNLYPAAFETLIREFAAIAEYQVELVRSRSMTEAVVVAEPAESCRDPHALAAALEARLRDAFALRIPVRLAEAGSLPRYELKAKRWLNQA